MLDRAKAQLCKATIGLGLLLGTSSCLQEADHFQDIFSMGGNENRISQLADYKLTTLASSDLQWTGVAVSETGRVFLNYPRWTEIPYSVIELVNGEQVPYPNLEWNSWDGAHPADHFVCVQSVYIDENNHLWIVDAGTAGTAAVITDAPKLIQVDLVSNQVLEVYPLGEDVVFGQSYLNDVRIDLENNYAYLTESGLGSLIAIDLGTGDSKRWLSTHSSVKIEFSDLTINNQSLRIIVHADGIGLTSNNEYLYYKALCASSLYRIRTDVLRNFELDDADITENVEFVINTFPSDGMIFDKSGNLIMTSLEDNSIYRLTKRKRIKKIMSSQSLTWPDSFAIDSQGRIYVTTSRIGFPIGSQHLYRLDYTVTDQ